MNKLNKALLLLKNGKIRTLIFIIINKLCRIFRIDGFLPPYPNILMIEPTNACNLQCPTCPTGSGKMNRPKRMLSLIEFKKIIDQAKGYLNEIILWNYGEPFLNKELLKMIKYAASANIKVRTSTNGQFFQSREFCRQVVQNRLQRLIVCLDGADQKTISRFRKGASFKNIIKGIRYLVEAKRDLDSETPKIELQFILMKHNEHQRRDIKKLAKKLKVDVYREKTVGIDYNDPDFQKMARELLPNDLSLSRYFKKPDGTFALKGEIPNSCPWVYRTAVINSDGTVVPCCYDLYSKHIMGNVFKESLKNIWKNKKYNAFRKQIKKDRKSIPICNICSEGRYIKDRKSYLK